MGIPFLSDTIPSRISLKKRHHAAERLRRKKKQSIERQSIDPQWNAHYLSWSGLKCSWKLLNLEVIELHWWSVFSLLKLDVDETFEAMSTSSSFVTDCKASSPKRSWTMVVETWYIVIDFTSRFSLFKIGSTLRNPKCIAMWFAMRVEPTTLSPAVRGLLGVFQAVSALHE